MWGDQNIPEQDIVVEIAQILQDLDKKYKIITPYAAQTSGIEKKMQDDGLNWEDTCFNVDAFQGKSNFRFLSGSIRAC